MTESALGRLIGTWEFEPMQDRRSLGRGRATFAWMEDRAFVLQRTDAQWSDPGWAVNAPTWTSSVIGIDDTTGELTMLYADARGVLRVYRGTLTDEAWRLERAAPGFHQRFAGVFQQDGRTIAGRWESSTDGASWEPDFDITYRRAEAMNPPRRQSPVDGNPQG